MKQKEISETIRNAQKIVIKKSNVVFTLTKDGMGWCLVPKRSGTGATKDGKISGRQKNERIPDIEDCVKGYLRDGFNVTISLKDKEFQLSQHNLSACVFAGIRIKIPELSLKLLFNDALKVWQMMDDCGLVDGKNMNVAPPIQVNKVGNIEQKLTEFYNKGYTFEVDIDEFESVIADFDL